VLFFIADESMFLCGIVCMKGSIQA
jgi:hypothetical protein